jgi:hypothetical protein
MTGCRFRLTVAEARETIRRHCRTVSSTGTARVSDPATTPEPVVHGRWVVYRLDDNANTFVVAADLNHEEAERLVALFESRGHKQLYWAQEQ